MSSVFSPRVAVLFLVSTTAFAQGRSANGVATQSTSTQVQQNTQAQMQGQAGAAGENAAAQAATATNVDAELKSTIDSKKAKAGDEVTAVTRSQAVLSNGTRLPKGTTLVGHVTEAAAYSKAAKESSVSFLFDQARLKDGSVMPIQAMVRGLRPSAAAMSQMNSSAEMDSMGPSAGVAGNGGVAAQPGAGGVLGGAGRAAGNVANSTVGAANSVVDRTGQAVGGAVDGAGRVAGNTVGNVSTAGTVGANGAVMTAVPGVMLSGATGTSASGTLSAQGTNVHVMSGTQMTLGVMSK